MPGITAVIHTHNDRLRIGRCLETLYPCDDILIVDHGSDDGTLRIANQYGARVTQAKLAVGDGPGRFAGTREWILCLDARESLTESLAASLYEWKTESMAQSAFAMFIREETVAGWIENPTPQTRLVPAWWNHWQGNLPLNASSACTLEGDVLRFVLP
jgi:glycosyltransferase involved in cell wall biosynthesis